MVKSRIELSKRQSGCIAAWYGISNSDEFLFLIQIAYETMEQFHEIKKLVEATLDQKDGGLESCLTGPPLLGLFDIDKCTKFCKLVWHNMSYNTHYASLD